MFSTKLIATRFWFHLKYFCHAKVKYFWSYKYLFRRSAEHSVKLLGFMPISQPTLFQNMLDIAELPFTRVVAQMFGSNVVRPLLIMPKVELVLLPLAQGKEGLSKDSIETGEGGFKTNILIILKCGVRHVRLALYTATYAALISVTAWVETRAMWQYVY